MIKTKIISFGSCLARRIAQNMEKPKGKKKLLRKLYELETAVMHVRTDYFCDTYLRQTVQPLSKQELLTIANTLVPNYHNQRLNLLNQNPFESMGQTQPHYKNFVDCVENGGRRKKLILIDNFVDVLYRLSTIKENQKLFILNGWFKNFPFPFQLQPYMNLDHYIHDLDLFFTWIRQHRPNDRVVFMHFPMHKSESKTGLERYNKIKYMFTTSNIFDRHQVKLIYPRAPRDEDLNPNYSHFTRQYYSECIEQINARNT